MTTSAFDKLADFHVTRRQLIRQLQHETSERERLFSRLYELEHILGIQPGAVSNQGVRARVECLERLARQRAVKADEGYIPRAVTLGEWRG